MSVRMISPRAFSFSPTTAAPSQRSRQPSSCAAFAGSSKPCAHSHWRSSSRPVASRTAVVCGCCAPPWPQRRTTHRKRRPLPSCTTTIKQDTKIAITRAGSGHRRPASRLSRAANPGNQSAPRSPDRIDRLTRRHDATGGALCAAAERRRAIHLARSTLVTYGFADERERYAYDSRLGHSRQRQKG